uniref:Secreted protein n=1 Tax=Ascaris lumbricoides TaxID=6252 RepID=A0A0M3IP14_ASCLU
MASRFLARVGRTAPTLLGSSTRFAHRFLPAVASTIRQNSTDSVEGKKALHTSAAQLAAPTTTAADAVKKVSACFYSHIMLLCANVEASGFFSCFFFLNGII